MSSGEVLTFEYLEDKFSSFKKDLEYISNCKNLASDPPDELSSEAKRTIRYLKDVAVRHLLIESYSIFEKIIPVIINECLKNTEYINNSVVRFCVGSHSRELNKSSKYAEYKQTQNILKQIFNYNFLVPETSKFAKDQGDLVKKRHEYAHRSAYDDIDYYENMFYLIDILLKESKLFIEGSFEDKIILDKRELKIVHLRNLLTGYCKEQTEDKKREFIEHMNNLNSFLEELSNNKYYKDIYLFKMLLYKIKTIDFSDILSNQTKIFEYLQEMEYIFGSR